MAYIQSILSGLHFPLIKGFPTKYYNLRPRKKYHCCSYCTTSVPIDPVVEHGFVRCVESNCFEWQFHLFINDVKSLDGHVSRCSDIRWQLPRCYFKIKVIQSDLPWNLSRCLCHTIKWKQFWKKGVNRTRKLHIKRTYQYHCKSFFETFRTILKTTWSVRIMQ